MVTETQPVWYGIVVASTGGGMLNYLTRDQDIGNTRNVRQIAYDKAYTPGGLNTGDVFSFPGFSKMSLVPPGGNIAINSLRGVIAPIDKAFRLIDGYSAITIIFGAADMPPNTANSDSDDMRTFLAIRETNQPPNDNAVVFIKDGDTYQSGTIASLYGYIRGAYGYNITCKFSLPQFDASVDPAHGGPPNWIKIDPTHFTPVVALVEVFDEKASKSK
jgi:hypothetical protein